MDFRPQVVQRLNGINCSVVVTRANGDEVWRSPKSSYPFVVYAAVMSRSLANSILIQAGLAPTI